MAQRAARQRRLAEWRFQRGLAMLSTGERVVTDRLHAHILSLLLDIPHVLLDNSYGKVAGFADQWTGDYDGLARAATRAAAFEARSEERRVGKAGVRKCRSRWWAYHEKKKGNEK